jgi:hypothetical protein
MEICSLVEIDAENQVGEAGGTGELESKYIKNARKNMKNEICESEGGRKI